MAHSSFEDLPSEIKLQILGHCTRYTLPTLVGASPTTLRLYRRYRRSVMGDIAQRANLGIYDGPGSSFEDEGGSSGAARTPSRAGEALASPAPLDDHDATRQAWPVERAV
ncbi:hypothetical protein PG989_007479 [Apiospora arundinis]